MVGKSRDCHQLAKQCAVKGAGLQRVKLRGFIRWSSPLRSGSVKRFVYWNIRCYLILIFSMPRTCRISAFARGARDSEMHHLELFALLSGPKP